MLYALASGPAARDLARRSAAERRAVSLDALVARFGPKAATPIGYYENDRTLEEWTHGRYLAHFPPGVTSEFGAALRDPVDRLHWAAMESSVEWIGTIEGAVRSGERAAREVLATGGARTGGEHGNRKWRH